MKISMIKYSFNLICFTLGLLFMFSCSNKVDEINIGYIAPLSKRATDLGIAPAKAMQLAVEQYNQKRRGDEPKVNLYIEDDQWQEDKAMPAYKKLRAAHEIKVLFISNSDGTVAISEEAKKDGVIVINPTNNDDDLNKLNSNVFKIAKSTEEAHSVIANRMIDLDLKKVIIMHYPNDFMTLGAKICETILSKNSIENNVVTFKEDKKDFTNELKKFKNEAYDAYVFFGYKEYGFAMKQARDLGITAKFFGSTVLLQEDYFENSEGTITDTEFIFFTPENGNFLLANNFLNEYQNKYKEKPFSVWPPMQAFDAMSLVLKQLKEYNDDLEKNTRFDDWLRNKLYKVRFYEGVCGNISIDSNGASNGIYFSLYRYTTKGNYININ